MMTPELPETKRRKINGQKKTTPFDGESETERRKQIDLFDFDSDDLRLLDTKRWKQIGPVNPNLFVDESDESDPITQRIARRTSSTKKSTTGSNVAPWKHTLPDTKFNISPISRNRRNVVILDSDAEPEGEENLSSMFSFTEDREEASLPHHSPIVVSSGVMDSRDMDNVHPSPALKWLKEERTSVKRISKDINTTCSTPSVPFHILAQSLNMLTSTAKKNLEEVDEKFSPTHSLTSGRDNTARRKVLFVEKCEKDFNSKNSLAQDVQKSNIFDQKHFKSPRIEESLPIFSHASHDKSKAFTYDASLGIAPMFDETQRHSPIYSRELYEADSNLDEYYQDGSPPIKIVSRNNLKDNYKYGNHICHNIQYPNAAQRIQKSNDVILLSDDDESVCRSENKPPADFDIDLANSLFPEGDDIPAEDYLSRKKEFTNSYEGRQSQEEIDKLDSSPLKILNLNNLNPNEKAAFSGYFNQFPVSPTRKRKQKVATPAPVAGKKRRSFTGKRGGWRGKQK